MTKTVRMTQVALGRREEELLAYSFSGIALAVDDRRPLDAIGPDMSLPRTTQTSEQLRRWANGRMTSLGKPVPLTV